MPQKELFYIWTDYQTAGRGQAGNSWESEEGKNLTFSVLLCPKDIPVEALFRLSMLVPLALVRVLRQTTGLPATIKWPNDIYIGDRKVCGILIENLLSSPSEGEAGGLFSIAGIGLNINQTRFVSPAPNPTSLAIETGREWDRKALLLQYIDELRTMRSLLTQPSELKQAYMSMLYRREGYHPYVEREVSTQPTTIQQAITEGMFMARIADILDDGQLLLETPTGERRTYHFKQIRYIIN